MRHSDAKMRCCKSVQLASQVAQPLEGGRECMIWSEQGLLRAGGESFVIDAYSQGAMYSMTEVSVSNTLPEMSAWLSRHNCMMAQLPALLTATLAAIICWLVPWANIHVPGSQSQQQSCNVTLHSIDSADLSRVF